MERRSDGCTHNWVKHGERSFFCSECGYFVETLEELQALLDYEKKQILIKVDQAIDEVNCEHKEQLKQKLRETIKNLDS